MKNCMLPMQCYTPTVASETSFSAFTSLYLLLNILSLHVHTIYSYIFHFFNHLFTFFYHLFSAADYQRISDYITNRRKKPKPPPPLPPQVQTTNVMDPTLPRSRQSHAPLTAQGTLSDVYNWPGPPQTTAVDQFDVRMIK